ncbi:MAG: serine/threonine-protein kinase [Anaerolineales bacterium]|nr:serine/threonine-protein kinase [Anaerolineales bacterium]
MADQLIGKTLGGRYTLIEKIKEGGMAMVYKARDTNLDRFVAVKLILPQRELSERFLARFKREAKSHARLSHPNIVTVFDYGEFDNKPYLVMEYIPDGTLKDLLGKPIPWQKAAQIVASIARALATAHTQGIIHRDVKPSNILMSNRREPRLSDFGIAKLIEGDEETADLTGSGMGVGTPDYMAPEQGVGQSDERSDIYALGVVFYQLVTGNLPFKADTPLAVMLKKSTEPLPRPTQFVPDIPSTVEKVLIKALASNPKDRYHNMNGFAVALETLQLGMVTPDTFNELPPDETTRDLLGEVIQGGSKKSNTIPWILSGGVLFFCLGILIAGIFLWSRLSSQSGSPVDAPQPTDFSSALTESPLALPTADSPSEFSSSPEPIFPTDPPVSPTFAFIDAAPTATSVMFASNGNLIAFNSRMGGNSDIYTVNINGGDLSRLTSSTAHDVYPSWSPDGTQIVYQTNEGGDQELVIINVSNKEYYAITNNTCNDWGPVWSPVGDWIAFYSDCDGERNIYKMRADGTDRTQLTFSSGSNSWFPAWSPDGKQITFSSNQLGKYHIYTMNSNGGEQVELAKGCVSYYSPDGRRILYGVYCNDTDELWLMNADGSNQRPITDGVECKNATWSPDGKNIVFQLSKTTGDGPFQIYIMDLDNPDRSNWSLVTDYDVNGAAPVWQP